MSPATFTSLAFALLASACGTGHLPEYRTSPTGQSVGSSTELAAITERNLRSQIQPATDRPLRFTQFVAPDYPPLLQIYGTQDKIRIMLRIEADGTTSIVGASKSHSEALLRSLEDAIRRWRFEPLTRGGSPTSAVVSVDFDFRLE